MNVVAGLALIAACGGLCIGFLVGYGVRAMHTRDETMNRKQTPDTPPAKAPASPRPAESDYWRLVNLTVGGESQRAH